MKALGFKISKESIEEMIGEKWVMTETNIAVFIFMALQNFKNCKQTNFNTFVIYYVSGTLCFTTHFVTSYC